MLDTPQDLSKIEMRNLYIFGIDKTSKQQTILAFDPINKKFSKKAIPAGLVVWNYTSPIYISEKCILISGGIS